MANRLGIFSLFLIQIRIEQQARHADDPIHGRAYFMTHIG